MSVITIEHWFFPRTPFELSETVRSPYDGFMLALHHVTKENRGYQQEPTDKATLSLPPDSTWIVFTDEVSHAVQSGQYMIRAPIAILERMSGAKLN